MKVSIIIPVYNVQEFLTKAIESCVNQTLQDIEILLIDDCSTDRSRNIMRRYAEKYKNIHLFYQKENKRQGAARNVGIRNAIGEYLMFLDGDDWISNNACELLYNKAKETDADMVAGNYDYIFNNRTDVVNTYDEALCGILDLDKKNKLMQMQGLHICRIYKRSMIIENKILYPENIFYEDSVFNTLTWMYAKSMYKVDTTFYHYRMNETSTTANIMNQYYMYDVGCYLLDITKDRGLLEEYSDFIFRKVTRNYSIALSAATEIADKESIELLYKIRNSFRSIKNSGIYPKDAENKLMKLNLISPKLLLAYCKISKLKNRRVKCRK